MQGIRIILIALLAVSTGARAAQSCSTQASTTADLAACAANSLARAERTLVRDYQRAQARLDELDAEFSRLYPEVPASRMRKALDASQAAWQRYRRAACQVEWHLTFRGNPNRGDYPGLAEIACEEKLVKERARQLREMLKENPALIPD